MNSPPNQLSADIENSSRLSSVSSRARIPLVYVLHSADMYGTERIALATAQGLGADFQIIFVGPLGPAIYEARKFGFETREFQSIPQLVKLLWKLLGEFDSLTFV